MTNTNKKVTFQLTSLGQDRQTTDVGANVVPGTCQNVCSTPSTRSNSSKFDNFSGNGGHEMRCIANQLKGLQSQKT